MEDDGRADDDEDADEDDRDGRRHDGLDDFGKGRHGGRVMLVRWCAQETRICAQ